MHRGHHKFQVEITRQCQISHSVLGGEIAGTTKFAAHIVPWPQTHTTQKGGDQETLLTHKQERRGSSAAEVKPDPVSLYPWR